MRQGLLGTVLLLAFAIDASATPAARAGATPAVPPLERFEPWPHLVERAAEVRIPTSGLAEPVDSLGIPLDSAVTALVVHTDGDRIEQWLLRIVARELNDKEKKVPMPPPQTVHTSTGGEITLASGGAAVAIHVLGPARPARGNKVRSIKDVWSGALVNGEFLTLGLDRAGSALYRLGRVAAEREIHGGISFGPQPFPPEQVEVARRQAEALGLTAADERALVGTVPALTQFFAIAASTPGVRDILRDLLDLNLWTIIRRGGMPQIGIDLLPPRGPIDLTEWGLPAGTEGHEFAFLVKLDGEPKLVCNLGAVAPRPPYSVCAGIVAMVVHPIDDPSSRVVLRVIASRPGKPIETARGGADTRVALLSP